MGISVATAASSSSSSNGLRSKIGIRAKRPHLSRNLFVLERRHHDDRRRQAGCPHGAQRLETVHPRHRDVADNEIEQAVVRELIDKIGAALGSRHVAAQTRERVGDGAEHRGIVVCHEHVAPHRSSKHEGCRLPIRSPSETGHEGPSTRGRVLARSRQGPVKPWRSVGTQSRGGDGSAAGVICTGLMKRLVACPRVRLAGVNCARATGRARRAAGPGRADVPADQRRLRDHAG